MTNARVWLLLILTVSGCDLFEPEKNEELSANLKLLSIETGTLSPPFSSEVTQYLVSFASYPRSFQLTASAEDTAASITVNNVNARSGQWLQVHTSPPHFVVNVTVISADSKHTKTYVLTIQDN